jgi:hypothetical protein
MAQMFAEKYFIKEKTSIKSAFIRVISGKKNLPQMAQMFAEKKIISLQHFEFLFRNVIMEVLFEINH